MAKRKPNRKSRDQMARLIDEFIAESTGSFKCGDIIRKLPEKYSKAGSHIEDEVEEIIEENLSALCAGFDEETFDTIYITDRNFYRDAEFCISPTEKEIKDGIIFPGHRFFPFMNKSISPLGARLAAEGSEENIPIREIRIPFSEIRIYHSLMHHEEFIAFLEENDRSNIRELGSRNGGDASMMRLKVFDFGEYFAKYEFAKGDALRVKPKDWDKGIFSFEFLPGEEKQSHFAEIRQWVDRMDEALQSVFEDIGIHTNAFAQLEDAFLICPALLKAPLISIGEYLRISQKTEISESAASGTILWRKGQNPIDEEDFFDTEPPVSISSGATGSLEEILSDAAIALSRTEIEAFIRDELFQGAKFPENVIARCLRGREKPVFRDEAQEVSFQNFIEEMWEDVSEGYDRGRDGEKGRVRSKILKIVESQNDFIRSLEKNRDFDLGVMDKTSFFELGRISRILGDALELLNLQKDGEEACISELENSLEATAAKNDSLIEKIKKSIAAKER